ncbi:MAG TPA: AsmA family protein, partial [Burkholderiales bacterium]|nr:AsmA family protein [Burkholderiales bacterium]
MFVRKLAIRRPGRWALGILAAIVVLFAALLLVAPLLVDLPSVRSQLERQASQAAGGNIAWNALEVRLFPFPHALMRGVRIDMAGSLKGDADAVELGLGLWPLLAGRVQVDAVTISKPALNLRVASSPAASPPSVDPFTAWRGAMQPVVQALRRFAPATTLHIVDGSVQIQAQGLPAIGATKMNLRAVTDAGGMALSGAFAGTHWDRVKIDARLGYANLDLSAQVEAAGMKPQTMLDAVLGDVD